MKRIRVVGSSGSGKSTFCKVLGQKLKIPHVEIDALFHKSNWGRPDEATFIKDVDLATQASEWIVDGNYSTASAILWAKTDTLIFLDLPLYTVLLRSTRRSLRPILTKEVLWNGNRETWGAILSFNKERNLILWTLANHKKRRAFYTSTELVRNYPNLEVLILKSPQAIADFLAKIPESPLR